MLEFALVLGCMVIGGSVLIALIVFFPLMIYAIPYELWIEAQQKQYNIPKDIPSKHMSIPQKTLFNAKNATKYYRSKITKQPHNITKF